MTSTSNHYVLAVPDLDRSADRCQRVLGCEREDVQPGEWALFARDGVTFMRGRCPDAPTIAELVDHQYFASLVVDDVEEVYAHAMTSGAELLFAPRTAAYGMRELALRTVDGHRMMIATRV